mmetsp:Transcript_14680/g.36580  ORF Transcript_14680/g.36580 Transcript_14680/m.36580 type:complete len:310 (-) Transcript_14680:196-1125(-)|eukprot:CAMPEP_0202869108 /NCGR_PEP_ID=MMETSP1391-20130828/11883_1 /ASSEMBLY_ACC=CAM_ASM_000867 /TAXON_ID=1034604 /ORGANISM="Chlamydomonas leiostraca, Strain SAG 11-49" /LENGTH=309 /DNA_ID=CAMNT_0049549369 /DNA_START=84 /DNA_END=1013 /DNA_ORIENTATION=+
MGGALAFFGHFFLGLGPGIAFFVVVLAPKSFLVLLSFTSAFYWLLILLITAGIFRGFLPIEPSQTTYAGLLVGSVAIQELGRYALWHVHRITVNVLDAHSRATGHRFDLADKLYLALGWGYGHAAANAIFFYLSFLPLMDGAGTWYYDKCPDMSIFLAGALYCLGICTTLVCLMVVAFEGWHTRSWLHMAYAPVMHLAIAVMTLGNFKRHGCTVVMPVLVAIGLLNIAYTAQLCWRKGAEAVQSSRRLSGSPVEGREDAVAVGVSAGPPATTIARRRGPRQAQAQFPLLDDDDDAPPASRSNGSVPAAS